MNKILLQAVFLIVFTFGASSYFAQTITIGAGTSNKYVPYNPYYGYTYSQSIFNQSEIALAGDIDKIRYYFNGNSAISDNPINIYIGHTTKSTFANTSDWIPVGSMTLVYSGVITTTAVAGWVEIDISNFAYNNTDNLVVAVHDNDAGYDSSSDYYYSTACTGNKTIYKYNDNPPVINPSSPPTGTLQAFRPNIQLVFVPTVPMSYTSSTVTQTNLANVSPGNANQEIIGIQITTANSASPFDVTQFQINMNGSTNGTVDVANIDVYSTGSSSTFATTTLFGSTAPAAGTININGTKTLQAGTNYFWVVYDIAGGATINNYVDAECTRITMNGGVGNKTPTVSAPAGRRKIVAIPPTYLMNNNTTVNTCYGVFYDSGGAGSNYSDNQSYTKTFCSDNGESIRFDFTSFNVQNTWDYLKIYDGSNTSSNLIGTYTLSVPTIVISSGTCLTFKFVSDCCTNNPGWSANISCFDRGICGTNPVANDVCGSATFITDVNGYCGNTSATYTVDSPGNLASNFCGGSIENNSWLKFTADSTSAEFTIFPSGCLVGDGIQVAIYETSDCTNFNLISCWEPFYNDAPGVMLTNGLIVGQDYYMMIDGWDGDVCNYQIGVGAGVALPIKLTSFELQCTNGMVLLNWTTQSEINNDYFTVEKSTDGFHFSAIGTINGAGNSSIPLNYAFADDSYLNKVSYYRLKQTDFDGKFSYSTILAAQCKNDDLYSSIYPNPAQNQLTFTYHNNYETNGSLVLIISNSLGELVSQHSYKQETFVKETIDISNLSNGVYHVMFVTKTNKEVHKLIVNR